MGARPSMTAETPRPPNDSLYSLQPTSPLSAVILRKSKLRWPASACKCSRLVIFISQKIDTVGTLISPVAKGVVTVVLPGPLQTSSAGSGPGPVGAPQKFRVAITVVPESLKRPQLVTPAAASVRPLP